MRIQDWVVVGLVAACLIWAVAVMIRRRRSGKGCCGTGGCAGRCSGCRQGCNRRKYRKKP